MISTDNWYIFCLMLKKIILLEKDVIKKSLGSKTLASSKSMVHKAKIDMLDFNKIKIFAL